MNLENQTLKAIQTSKAFCQVQLKKETNPHIKQKIQQYLEELTKEEQKLLKQQKTHIDDYENIDDTILEG